MKEFNQSVFALLSSWPAEYQFILILVVLVLTLMVVLVIFGRKGDNIVAQGDVTIHNHYHPNDRSE